MHVNAVKPRPRERIITIVGAPGRDIPDNANLNIGLPNLGAKRIKRMRRNDNNRKQKAAKIAPVINTNAINLLLAI